MRYFASKISRVGNRYLVEASAQDMDEYRSIADNCGLLKNW